ncbi:MAG: diguanylate cyclase [Lachnospiraceae bacterium]|nr:diguanylate cyclase [Lachnospiraceae bacterium]
MNSNRNATKKYITWSLLFFLGMNLLLGLALMNQTKQSMTEMMRSNMLDVSVMAAAELDGDTLSSLKESSVGTPEYNEVYDTLSNYFLYQDLEYIYTVRVTADGDFVFLIDPDPVDPGRFGEPVTRTDALEQAAQGTAAVDEAPFTDRWGSFYSAYSPVYDSKGQLAAIVAVDFREDWFQKGVNRYVYTILLVIVVTLILGTVIVLNITDRFKMRFDQIYRELAGVSEDVEDLSREISSGRNFPEQFRPEICLNEEDKALIEAGERDQANVIEALSARIRLTHSEISSYIEFARSMAYTDAMTGVGNKTAYLERIETLKKGMETRNLVYTIAILDINGLKKINDNFGHDVGDCVIRDTAVLLMRVFDVQKIFRIGGDEFIVVMEDAGDQEMKALFRKLDAELDSFNRTEREYEAVISFSKGCARYMPETDHDFRDVFKRADESMYRDKAVYYQTHPDRRSFRI